MNKRPWLKSLAHSDHQELLDDSRRVNFQLVLLISRVKLVSNLIKVFLSYNFLQKLQQCTYYKLKYIFVYFQFFFVFLQGSTGTKVDLKANYFRLKSKTDWCLYQYRVDIAPEEDRTQIRKALLREHKDALGFYLFDGTVLFSPNRYKQVSTSFSHYLSCM